MVARGAAIASDVPAVIDRADPLKGSVTDEELQEAATSLGMRTFKPKRAQLLKKLGMHHATQGVVHMGLGQLAYVDDSLCALMDRAVELANDPDTEIAVSAIQAGKAVADSMRENVKFQVELQQSKLLEAPKPQRALVNFEQPVVIQVTESPKEKSATPIDGRIP
jgi:hypothetical protein